MAAGREAPAPLRRRLLWFVALWSAGVGCVGTVAWLLKLWIGA